MVRRVLAVLPFLCACATPGGRYFAGEGRSCDDVRAARAYADAHAEITNDQKADVLLDTAHCEVLAGAPQNVPALLDEAVKLDPKESADAQAERAALLAKDGKQEEAVAAFQAALDGGFSDFDQLMNWPEFEKLVAAPELERALVSLAAEDEPAEPRVLRLAEKLHQVPVTPVVVEANPDYGLNTFVFWRGQVLESHYDRDNNETAVLLEELVPHRHAGSGEKHLHFKRVWLPSQGYVQVPHADARDQSDAEVEYEATGRLFGLRVPGFPRELVEAPDLEVVGYYIGRTPFTYHGEDGDAPTLQVVRAVPFESGVHPGRPVAHPAHE